MGICLAFLLLAADLGCIGLARRTGRAMERREPASTEYQAEDLSAIDPVEPALRPPAALRKRDDNRLTVLGDIGAILDRDKRIDVRATIDALVAMHANTFAMSIVQSPTAWEQLPELAEAAAREDIDIWVYLMPWSETPKYGKFRNWCEPFRLDFVEWGRQVSALSRKHPNITGMLLDDFASNNTQPDRFTPEYVADIQTALKSQNPKLQLHTILYFQQPWADFMERFADVVDGAVVCYPASVAQIDSAAAYLQGQNHGAALLLDMGRRDIGEAATTSMRARLRPPPGARLRFMFDAANISKWPGTHTAYVEIDGKRVWSRKVSARATVTQADVRLPASDGDNVKVTLGVTGHRKDEASEFLLRFEDVTLLNRNGTPARQPRWELDNPGNVIATLQQPGPGTGRTVPMMLMPPTDPEQYAKRYGKPRNMADAVRRRVELCLQSVRAGRATGVVNFYTPKERGDAVFNAVAEAFAAEKR
jgi:hypothetical protein